MPDLTPAQLRAATRQSEASFTRQVLNYAALHGWLCYHARPARTAKGWRTAAQGNGAKGFPDLILARGPGHAIRLVAAELKVGKRGATVEQYAWLGAFHGTGVSAYLWTPDDWPEIERVLQ